jgi:hypothetical protein
MIKLSLAPLLLLSTLLSCASSTTPPTPINSPTPITTKPSPTFDKDFYLNPETETTFPETVITEEGIPITVTPPPLTTSTPPPSVSSLPSYPFILMRNTGTTNRFGNPIYLVEMYNKGNLISSVKAVSGRAHTQQRNRNVAGTEAPLPNGHYRIAANWVPSSIREVGGRFLPITPLFSTGRSALGFHVDPSFDKQAEEDGTEGCIGLTTTHERDTLFDFVQTFKPHYLLVNI